MTLVASTMLSHGTEAPDFSLPDVVSGETVTLKSSAGPKGLLVMFICRHCPYVKHIEQELARIGKDYADSGVGIVAISSNEIDGYPDDAPDKLKVQAEDLGFVFPYCYDETQETARAFTASCTPDFFLFDADLKLVYRGQFDDSRPGNDLPVSGLDVRVALDDLLAGREPTRREQKPSIGCNIKWKPGNEPPYFTG